MAGTVCIAALCPSVSWAAHPCKAGLSPPGINQRLESRLVETFDCFGKNASRQSTIAAVECEDFVAGSIQREWSLDHFWLEDESRFMTVREIGAWLPIEGSLSGWEFLGSANEAGVQEKAAERAATGQPVVAVNNNGRTPGKVALVLPGALHNSGTYGIPVTRIAQTGARGAASSFVGCAFSYGFGRKKAPETLIYGYRGET